MSRTVHVFMYTLASLLPCAGLLRRHGCRFRLTTDERISATAFRERSRFIALRSHINSYRS